MEEHWLLVDGYNLAFRAFYALPDLTGPDGAPSGALYGWVQTLWRLQEAHRPTGILVFFDLGPSTRHLQLLPDYKAHRKATPEAFRAQIPWIKQATQQMGYSVLETAGVEADDALGAYARLLAQGQRPHFIVSSDKDFAQCVGDYTRCLLPPLTGQGASWRCLDATGVEEKFGVKPPQIPLFLALVGDVSDNIPGITGVGPKTAAQWLKGAQSWTDFWHRAPTLMPVRLRERLLQNQVLVERNLALTQLDPAAVADPASILPLKAPDPGLLDTLSRFGLHRLHQLAQTRMQGAAALRPVLEQKEWTF